MAWFLFIDESGQDRKDSPYEVLAGVAIRDDSLWPLIQSLHDVETAQFGRRYSEGRRELKGKKLLKRKVFQHAELNCQVLPNEVPSLSRSVLNAGAVNSSVRHLKALALAKIAYVTEVFSLVQSSGCKAFASIVASDAPRSVSTGLRKDYAYLFERFFYFLEDEAKTTHMPQQGILVFDELEKSQSHILIDQANRYFKDTATGRLRATLVVPEPFFVHSDLTTGVQIADLVAGCLSWGFRLPVMTLPARIELRPYADQLARLRHRTVRKIKSGEDWEVWSFAYIADLRTSIEKR